ncbi:MAG TPA: single-stranded DNA-binding protein [Caulobacteraceae bacterium]|nr:single-stranded DNA-binding protein [Caulobacteraceae bacterium]
MQSVTVEGYVAADPSILTSNSGDRRASFRVLETTAFQRADGERAERTTGFSCICFSDPKVRAYIEPYLSKGSRVIVNGHVENNKWTDREGADHYDLRLVVNDLRIKNKRDADDTGADAGRAAGGGRFKPGMTEPTYDLDDEIPF